MCEVYIVVVGFVVGRCVGVLLCCVYMYVFVVCCWLCVVVYVVCVVGCMVFGVCCVVCDGCRGV